MGLTYGPGYQWYFANFFGQVPQSATTTLNNDGSATVADFGANENTTLSSAAQISSAPYFRGTAFGGGGYFEATLAFNAATINTSTGWPAWWSMALEHLVGLPGQQWTGQASGYTHYIEPDFMEKEDTNSTDFGGAVHDWYGVYLTTCSGQVYCNYATPYNIANRVLPAATNFSQYHRYGLLWVPATATKSGSITYFFDGVQVGSTINYTQYTNQAPVPTATTPWTFGVIDKQHLVLILGTGASTPMQVQSVTVWQASTANNMYN
jgi:hypothetical protein